jgi:ABC-type transport system involved in multi-copper enzyme maturation permease subunit
VKKSWALAVKEWKEVSRDFYVLGILIFLPLTMVATLVMLIYFYLTFFIHNLDKVKVLLDSMPRAYIEGLAGYGDIQKVAILPIKIIGLPFFLLIPLLISGIITADSFAGERERATLEALLTTPIEDHSLLLGKILTPFAPALAISWISFAILTAILARLVNPHFLNPIFPDTTWILSMLFVLPLFLLGTVVIEILISSKVSSVKAASALNMLLAFPVLGVMLLQSTGFVLFQSSHILFMIVGMALIDAILFLSGLKIMDRSNMLGR